MRAMRLDTKDINKNPTHANTLRKLSYYISYGYRYVIISDSFGYGY